jgi:hypothetical protein
VKTVAFRVVYKRHGANDFHPNAAVNLLVGAASPNDPRLSRFPQAGLIAIAMPGRAPIGRLD